MKQANTPLSRWKYLTQHAALALPLSPPKSEWLMTLYDHDIKTLNRKTGITYKGFNYKGDKLPYLIDKFGEIQMNILVNPDDYRVIYVNEGDDLPLVLLTEEFVTATTPAFSFEQRRAQVKEDKENISKNPTAEAFTNAVQTASMQMGSNKPQKKQSKTEGNRVAAAKAKEALAFQRAIDNPVIPPGKNVANATTQSPSIQLSEAPPLQMLDRTSGTEQT